MPSPDLQKHLYNGAFCQFLCCSLVYVYTAIAREPTKKRDRSKAVLNNARDQEVKKVVNLPVKVTITL